MLEVLTGGEISCIRVSKQPVSGYWHNKKFLFDKRREFVVDHRVFTGLPPGNTQVKSVAITLVCFSLPVLLKQVSNV